MFFARKNKNEVKEGIVVVSISNLFHILDISRTNIQEDVQLHKSNTRNVYFIEQGKEKESIFLKKDANHDVLIENKSKDIKGFQKTALEY